MTTPQKLSTKELLAPCGMNCSRCSHYLAMTHGLTHAKDHAATCKGCRPRNKQCAYLKKHCDKLKNNELDFCFECGQFPCKRLAYLDDLYQRQYQLSPIDNLRQIQKLGVEGYIRSQKADFACPDCGDMICMHNQRCYNCNPPTRPSPLS